MHDRTKDAGAFGHQPPVVVWRCNNKPPHRLLRVFLSPDGWHLMGDRLRVPVEEWLQRTGSDLTVEDLRDGSAEAMNKRTVQGVDRALPLDIDAWPAGVRFEVGCRCGTVWAHLDWLADDARRARDTRTQVVRHLD